MALTKVVLLCIQNKRQQPITHDQIYNNFLSYGQCEKILIFEKSQIWKIFLELQTKEQASSIIKNCNNSTLNGDSGLRVQVYSSNLETVNFADSNSAGKDYSKSKNKRDSFNSTDDELTSNSSYGELLNTINSIKNHQQNNIQQSIYQFQQILQQHLYEQQVLQMRLQTHLLDLQGPMKSMTSQWIEQLETLGKLLQTQYSKQFQIVENYINYIKTESQTKPVVQIHDKSRVIVAKSFDDSQTSLDMLYNLFSIYGNIDKMVYQKDKSTLFVEYHLQKCADQAIEKLSNVKFQGQILKINYSVLQELVFLDELEEMGLVEKTIYEERFIGSESTNRYKPKNSFVAAAPNDTVFLMNLSNELLDFNSLKPLLESEIVDYKYYVDPKQKHSCAIRFQTTEDAMVFLAKNHGKVIDERKILMTFSKKPM